MSTGVPATRDKTERRRRALEAATGEIAAALAGLDREDCGVAAAPHIDFALQVLRAELRSVTLCEYFNARDRWDRRTGPLLFPKG